jgi:hypothetical protein
MESACAGYAAARCALLDRCAPFVLAMDHGTAATCASQLQAGCLAVAGLPGTALVPVEIESCAAALAAPDCAQALARLGMPLCGGRPGGAQVGAACVDGFQCASRSCDRKAGAACGTCQARAGAGEPCARTTDCPDGLVCSASYRCLAAGGEGASCDGDKVCAGYLLCRAGTCAKGAAEGQGCANGDCATKLGMQCDPATSTCKAIGLAAASEPCGMVAGAPVACRAGGTCEGYPAQTEGRCLAAVAQGKACDRALGPACIAPAECIEGTCRVPDSRSCP